MKKIIYLVFIVGLVISASALDAKFHMQIGPGFELKYDYVHEGMPATLLSLDITDIYKHFGLKLAVSTLDVIAQPKYYYFDDESGAYYKFADKTIFYSMGALYTLDFLKVCRFTSYLRMGISNIAYTNYYAVDTYIIAEDLSMKLIGNDSIYIENSFTIGLGFGLEFEFSPFNIIPGLEFEYIHSFKKDVDFHMTRLCFSLAFDLLN